jgi:ribosomal-protein-alanine N-acetyltransferase
MNTKINENIFEHFPSLESERLIFREFHKDDSSSLFMIRSNERAIQFMDTIRHVKIEESEILISNIISSYLGKTGITWAVIEKFTGEFIGYIGFWRLIREHCRAEIGYALMPEYWGRGYMSEALHMILEFGFNVMKVHSVEANVNPFNERSIRVLEKTGFKREAWFRENFLFNNQFLDSFIYSILETDFKPSVE